MNNRLINTKVAGGGGGTVCTDIVDNYDPFDGGGLALYQLNGNATDVSGNYNGNATLVTYGAGVFGQAGVFNGSSSVISNSNITPLASSNVMSISIWFKRSDINVARGLISIGLDGSAGGGLALLAYGYSSVGSGNLFFEFGSGLGRYIFTNTTNTNQWYHIVITSDGSTVNGYLNGSFQGSSSVGIGAIGPTAKLTIGGIDIIGADTFHNGSIDQVRIFNTALTPLEVEALYTEELCICDGTVDTLDILGDGSCIATYQLDGNANDLSGNYSGQATNVSYGVGEFDLAGVFNGSSSYIKAPNPLYTGSPLTDYTFSAWFKINAYGDQYPTIFAGQTGGTSLPPYLWVSASILRLHGYTYNDYTNTLSTGVWYNAVMVNSGTTTDLYLNGSLQTPTSRNTYTTTTGEFFVLGGIEGYPTTTSFDGQIDQVRIFNKALNSTEVTTLYNETACTVVSKSPGTLADYDFFSDNSGRGWSFDNTKASLQDAGATMVSASNTYGTGKFGQALYFNGNQTAGLSSDTYNTIFDVSGSEPYTVSVWFNATTGSKRNIVWYADDLGDTSIELGSDNRIYFGSGANYFNTPSTYPTNTWIHAACTWIGDSIKCYINGQYVGTAASRPATGSATCLGHPGVGLTGYVDQFRYFRRPLTDEEVLSVYNESN